MCWQSTNINLQVSDGNVKVTKICRLVNKTKIVGCYFTNFQYELNEKYTQKMHITCKANQYFGNEGFHSYSTDKCKVDISKGTKLNYTYKCIRVHSPKQNWVASYYTRLTGKPKPTLAVVNGYIPKGMKYSINENGEIISEGIILTEIASIVTTK